MDVPHFFFHCSKEIYQNTLYVTAINGRLLFQEVHVPGNFVNSYTERGEFTCVLPEVTAF